MKLATRVRTLGVLAAALAVSFAVPHAALAAPASPAARLSALAAPSPQAARLLALAAPSPQAARLLALAAPSPQAAPMQIPVEYEKLKNGLKVVYSRDTTAPTAVVAVYYNIG
ncbi:MAG TPA: hypothetical protein VH854_14525, partial [Thermoanaerobaculia bacterium]|nr:hypothetical protein [Thermoanaerobaculia bacterium]